MDSSQESLVAGLFTSLLASTVAPSSTPHLASYTHPPFATSSPIASDRPHHGSGKNETIREWSSLIGIVTALIGNILISLALNIQRYAHIRIAREWEHEKIQKETYWRHSDSGSGTANPYGTLGDNGTRIGLQRGRPREQGRHSQRAGFEAYRDSEEGTDGRIDVAESQNQHRGSFSSDATERPENKDAVHGHRKSYLRSPYWWVGIVLMCVGETGNFLAYGFAPASIVSPLGVVALISNCVVAPCLLKEKFRQRDFWGVLVAIAGAVVVVLSAKSSEDKIGPHDIWVMITRWEFELYLGLTISLIVGLMWASYKYGPRSILIDVGLVALFGGYTALSTKGVASLLSYTLWHVITFPITYLLVFILVFSALMQIRYINRALQRFDSTQVIPTQFVLFTLSVIIGSAILYRDFESITAARAAKFVGGCLMTFLGVYFITSGRVRADDESSFSSDDEEESIGLLNGERYQDRVDLSPPGQQLRTQKALRAAPEAEDVDQSPSGSLLSRGIEGIDDHQPTPRGVLSAAPSSPGGSLTAESTLSAASLDHTSPLRPPSRMSNPWANSHDDSAMSNTQITRPVTPPGQADDAVQASTVLLRFPQAPGLEETPEANEEAGLGRRASTPLITHPNHLAGRHHTTGQTPTRHAFRDSISNRFSPGPLLPTLSAGFSAVVAESLRRGEGSPLKDRTRRRLGRRRQLEGAFTDDALRYRDGEAGPSGVDGDGHDTPLTLANARLQSATSFAATPAEAGRSTPALATELYAAPAQKSDDDITRLRSLSDSWSGGLAWLGGALRMNPHKSVDSVAATQDTPSPQNLETQSSRGNHDRPDADTETDARR
ncbi:hypothetical protein NUU61_002121 [Penicillium alfredii]|uniref:Uncharacterized protein n=1 Tax=Penicillium alfredii TaxID=1506179 RepID=A0A9W9KFP3_9EURO|nr:uncharacterized protein NUU61_002121 [Penicillium alfredii]KAJ5104774.1 hypothetical protein NUU61_002121 [Penicillium alfredii]